MIVIVSSKSLQRVCLIVESTGAHCRFSCEISNIGNSEIKLGNAYLFVDEGIYNSEKSCYEFPFTQKKFLGIDGIDDSDCILCAQCKRDLPEYPIGYSHVSSFYKTDLNLFHNCYVLPHLSYQSILYMAPGEVFTEEIILKLKPGVYRAILASVPDTSTCDCICCNRCFIVQESLLG